MGRWSKFSTASLVIGAAITCTPVAAQQAPVQPITPRERAEGAAANNDIVGEYG